jgi:hypothetical protein
MYLDSVIFEAPLEGLQNRFLVLLFNDTWRSSENSVCVLSSFGFQSLA